MYYDCTYLLSFLSGKSLLKLYKKDAFYAFRTSIATPCVLEVPAMELNAEDWEIVALVNRELEHYTLLLEDAREREAISAVFNISRLGNQLMQHNTPWKLVKVN